MSIQLWTPNDLYALRRDDRMDDVPAFFLNEFFTSDHYAEDGEIRFGDLEEDTRFMAPFVLPYEQGKPMHFMAPEKVEAFRVPYIKLKRSVRTTDAKNVKPSDIFRNGGQLPTMVDRFEARVAELDRRHRRAIRVREAWMAARAIIDGAVRIQYERDQGVANPDVLLNFGRDPSHTVVKTDNFWSDPSADIIGDLETWINRMYLTAGGGSASMLIVGAQVAAVFKRNEGIKKLLDRTIRGGTEDVKINLGINRISQPMTYIGQLESGLPVWSYKDTVDVPGPDDETQRVDLFNQKDILLVAPGANGVRVRGPIYDTEAFESGQIAAEVFAKMWETDDPGERWIMHQASFLPVPLYPNRTFKARVLA
ncbi:major capsid protein [Paracoccus sp. (in: a-proteobacteria)]|uniref:major capsid protein n=1 Tax=Paracoccus sp. TaxID=267 RepID=UPI0026DF3E4F|nr:major capsid protein [Paracoccus sp. (in: a-proteobacteria)]MDO5646308.1 major capsid protein [Paracoccus sp. (in: a-proteobacteria)]